MIIIAISALLLHVSFVSYSSTEEQTMNEVRAYVFRLKALEAERKAQRPNIPESTRRAWLIVARDWTRMAEREEAKLANEPHNSGEDERDRKGKS